MALKKVLIVDDEIGVRESIRMLLKDRYELALANSGSQAINMLSEVRPDVVLLDLRMPDMGGIEVLQNIKAKDPQVEVILITAYATVDTARKALRLGAFDYLTKPFNPVELEGIVQRGIERRMDELRRTAMMEAIQQDYQSLRKEVEMAKHQITTHVHGTIYALLMSLELRDAYSGRHSMAVLWLVDQFCQRLGVPNAERLRLKRAALVHDLGKIGVPEEILNKQEPLTPSNLSIMQNHAILSGEIITNVEALADLAPMIRSHHERWDGHGYPDGLEEDDIPWQAQVLAICDTVHAMSSDRCYRARLPEKMIRAELRAQSGRQFKPEYVEVMLASTLISEIHQAEDAGQMVLTSQQVRDVLDEESDSELFISE
ncbi:MAG TPA: HD domain-containing phosphohydrolase [Armatimonadota bacterium]|jgi:putative two-component system response regulator